jgi:hypothetical protein
MSPNFIVEALTNGIMKDPGSVLSPGQRVALAEFLTGKKVGAEAAMAGRCGDTPPPFSLEERRSMAGEQTSRTGGSSQSPELAWPNSVSSN